MEMENIKLQFEEQGLLPAIIQDFHTKKVLMLAYMNRESFEKHWRQKHGFIAAVEKALE